MGFKIHQDKSPLQSSTSKLTAYIRFTLQQYSSSNPNIFLCFQAIQEILTTVRAGRQSSCKHKDANTTPPSTNHTNSATTNPCSHPRCSLQLSSGGFSLSLIHGPERPPRCPPIFTGSSRPPPPIALIHKCGLLHPQLHVDLKGQHGRGNQATVCALSKLLRGCGTPSRFRSLHHLLSPPASTSSSVLLCQSLGSDFEV